MTPSDHPLIYVVSSKRFKITTQTFCYFCMITHVFTLIQLATVKVQVPSREALMAV